MRFSLVLVAALCAAAPASAFTLEQVMSAPFCGGLVAAARAPRIAWIVNLRGERPRSSRAIVVLSVDYRLGIMYGRDFREAANGSWRGSSEYQDIVAAAGYLAALPQVDRKRIGLWGGSYGGLLTALGLARNSELFKAGVDFHGVHDWSVLLGDGDDGFADAPDKKDAQDLALRSSPLADVARWRSPVLLIHGDDDRNVPFDQTTDLVQRLRRQGVRVDEIVYPDEIHDLLLWRSWIDAYRATAAFFMREL